MWLNKQKGLNPARGREETEFIEWAVEYLNDTPEENVIFFRFVKKTRRSAS